MPWFKVDDQLFFNAKTVIAGNSAMGLWVRAGSWSSANLTDGFVPTHMANAMANPMANPCDPDALVQAGLWEVVDGGFRFHDWSDFQPSAAVEKEKRKKRAEAGRLGAIARWGGKDDGNPHSKSHADGMANEWQTDAPSRPDPTRPEEEPSSASRKKPARKLPEDWTPTDTHHAKAAEKGLSLDHEAENFRLHAETHDRKAANWNSAFTMWLNKATPRQQTIPMGRPTQGSWMTPRKAS